MTKRRPLLRPCLLALTFCRVHAANHDAKREREREWEGKGNRGWQTIGKGRPGKGLKNSRTKMLSQQNNLRRARTKNRKLRQNKIHTHTHTSRGNLIKQSENLCKTIRQRRLWGNRKTIQNHVNRERERRGKWAASETSELMGSQEGFADSAKTNILTISKRMCTKKMALLNSDLFKMHVLVIFK